MPSHLCLSQRSACASSVDYLTNITADDVLWWTRDDDRRLKRDATLALNHGWQRPTCKTHQVRGLLIATIVVFRASNSLLRVNSIACGVIFLFYSMYAPCFPLSLPSASHFVWVRLHSQESTGITRSQCVIGVRCTSQLTSPISHLETISTTLWASGQTY